MFALQAYAPVFTQSNEYTELLQSFMNDEDEQEKLVQANAALQDLDSEAVAVFKVLREQYAPRFPELESFELNSLQYARVVLALGAGDFGGFDVSAALQNCALPAALVMIVAVTASTTKGRLLTTEEAGRVHESAQMILRMSAAKAQILKFIESRMDRLAPNVTALVGVSVASQLIGAAGGIVQLSRIPAGNIQVIGAGGRKHLAGLSSASASLHAGFVASCPLVEEVDADYRKNALRLLSAKVAIAARVDAAREHGDGSFGRQLYEEIVGKLEKISAPPPLKGVKPLPIPDSERKKRRGGKRARKLKELYAQTEMRKQKNRMAFGEAAEVEVLVGDRMEGLGMLGAATGSGSLRLNPTGSNTDAKLREHLKKQAQSKLSTSGASGSKAMQIMQDSGQISLQAPKQITTQSTTSSSSTNNTRYFNQNVGFRKVKE